MNLSTFTPEYSITMDGDNLSPRTMDTYLEAVASFQKWLDTTDEPPRSVELVQRKHIRRWLVWLKGNDLSSATANNRFRGLRHFFCWLQEDEYTKTNPFAGLKPPKVETKDVRILQQSELKALVDVCRRDTLWGCRDAAIIWVLACTGMRRAEVTNLRVRDLDLKNSVVHIHWTSAKGRKERSCPLKPPAVKALHRYLHFRAEHPTQADSEHLWLGQKGPLKVRGLASMIDRRAKQADIGKVHPHVFRHTMAHWYLAGGGQETNLMSIMGWTSREMLSRYAASAGAQRAHEEYHRLDLGII